MNPDLQHSINFIKEFDFRQPQLALILGSGLGSFADLLEKNVKIATTSIPHYPESTVEGHQGYLVFGEWKGAPILAVQGRTHYYEGHPIAKVTYVVRIIAALGVKTIIITNAAGGVNKHFQPGDLMLITDMINYMFQNPLRGPLISGDKRFPDMSEPFSQKYFNLVEEIALENGINLKQGVLYVSSGPSYETASEVKMISILGGDAASMSTVPEVIVARQLDLDVIGISCITNYATGISKQPLRHSDVTETAKHVQEKFLKLISGIIQRIPRS
jgi:purine-nucleoside phosphorylase